MRTVIEIRIIKAVGTNRRDILINIAVEQNTGQSAGLTTNRCRHCRHLLQTVRLKPRFNAEAPPPVPELNWCRPRNVRKPPPPANHKDSRLPWLAQAPSRSILPGDATTNRCRFTCHGGEGNPDTAGGQVEPQVAWRVMEAVAISSRVKIPHRLNMPILLIVLVASLRLVGSNQYCSIVNVHVVLVVGIVVLWTQGDYPPQRSTFTAQQTRTSPVSPEVPAGNDAARNSGQAGTRRPMADPAPAPMPFVFRARRPFDISHCPV